MVYTKPWVVELILDLAGYTTERDLVSAHAIEPAAGDGAFLVPMVRRLVASCHRQSRALGDLSSSLLAYELDECNAMRARDAVRAVLLELEIPGDTADQLSASWVRTGDYLFEAPHLPPADFVIGNPPYIRLEDMDEHTAAMYRATYRSMMGRADIYVAFFEAALRQLQPKGVCAFICADRWMLNQYGSALRQFVTQNYSVEAVVEMHTADAFADDVSAYPAITVIRRHRQGAVVVASVGAGAQETGGQTLALALRQIQMGNATVSLPPNLHAAHVDDWFTSSDPWPCIEPERLALLKQLESRFPPLESEETGTKVGIGVATGADEIFITSDPSLVESSRLLPLAMAGDTVSGSLRWSGHYLVNPWIGTGLVDLAAHPRLRSYLERNRDSLQRRHVATRNPTRWYRTIDRVNHDLTHRAKLYIPDIKDRLNPVLDEGKTYPHHNLYFIQSDIWDLEVLGGLLMSEIGQFFVECYGVRMRGGYLRFQAQYLRRIRVPSLTDLTSAQAAALVDAFRRRDVALATQVAIDIYQIRALPRRGQDA